MDAEERRLDRLLDAERKRDLADNPDQLKKPKTEKKITSKKVSKKGKKSESLKDPAKIFYDDWFGDEGEEMYSLKKANWRG